MAEVGVALLVMLGIVLVLLGCGDNIGRGA
jgi:hypothetical protein